MNPFRPSPAVAEIIASLRNEPHAWHHYDTWGGRLDNKGKSFYLPLYMPVLNRKVIILSDNGELKTVWPNIFDRWRLRRAIKQWRVSKI